MKKTKVWRKKTRSFIAIFGIALAVLIPLFMKAGSDSSEIKVLDVDTGVKHKEAPKEKKRMTSLPENVNLIMGIVIPTSNRQWFIKMAGPYDEFKQVTPMFDKIRETIKFDDYSVEEVTFDLAEGWNSQREKGFIHSSITHPELTSKFTISSAKGTLLDNVNRWYKQLGMQPINNFGLTQLVQRTNINGYFGLIIPIFRSKDAPAVLNNNPHGDVRPEDKPLATPPSKGIRIAFGVAQERTWYLKMMGDSNTLVREKKNFEAFVTSFKFKDGSADWTVPEGWEKTDGGSMSIGSFKVGSTVITVTPLGANSGTVLDNVNRWRRQIGLEAASMDDISKSLEKLQVDGNEFNYILLTNTASPAREPVRDEELTYTVPEGWKENAPSSMRRMNLEASGMAVTGIFLGKAAQGLKKNVDRWCGQIGLEPLTDEQLAEAAKKIPFNGKEADYAILKGKEQSILVVLYNTENGVWFFKVMGETEKIMNEKASFEKLVASIKIKEE